MAKAITRSSSEQSVLRSVLAVTEREPTDEHEHCRRRRNAAKWKLAFQRSVSPLVLARGTRCSLGFLHSSGPTFRQRRAVGGVHPIADDPLFLDDSILASLSSGPVSPRVLQSLRVSQVSSKTAGNTKLRTFPSEVSFRTVSECSSNFWRSQSRTYRKYGSSKSSLRSVACL